MVALILLAHMLRSKGIFCSIQPATQNRSGGHGRRYRDATQRTISGRTGPRGGHAPRLKAEPLGGVLRGSDLVGAGTQRRSQTQTFLTLRGDGALSQLPLAMARRQRPARQGAGSRTPACRGRTDEPQRLYAPGLLHRVVRSYLLPFGGRLHASGHCPERRRNSLPRTGMIMRSALPCHRV